MMRRGRRAITIMGRGGSFSGARSRLLRYVRPFFCLHLLFFVMTELMDEQTLRDRIETVRQRRGFLLDLLEQPDLGTLRLDVNQALEELDELLEEYERVFPA